MSICEKHGQPGCICQLKNNPRNTKKGWKKKPKNICKKGHELTTENTLLIGKLKKRRCRICANAKSAEWQKNNPDKFSRSMKNYSRKLLYKITEDQYNLMLEKQNGLCAICKQPPINEPLCIDHNHETDEIRGLLHRVCNTGIGNLKDNSALCRLAADYLDNPPARGLF